MVKTQWSAVRQKWQKIKGRLQLKNGEKSAQSEKNG